MELITDTGALDGFCRDLSKSAYITVDTEFMRETTFWSRLCLVQVAGEQDARAIDPLAPNIDLAPLFRLLRDQNVLKVFHAARQDLEIFYHLMGDMPQPVFDTQIAAMVCGFGDQVGYSQLISALTNAKIDKASRFTDWSIRPLKDRQVDYAMADVTHLRQAYEKLLAKLGNNGRAEWLDEEMAVLTAPATYEMDPDKAYLRLKVRDPKPRFLAVLREVAAWREREAQARDVPRNRVLRDEILIEIAHHTPATPEELSDTRGLGRKLAMGHQGDAILKAVARGRDVPDADCPQPPAHRRLPRDTGPTSELLKVLLKMKCMERDVAQKLVASASEVDRLAAFGEDADVPALHGWRREIFGEDALKLRSGELALSIRNGKLALRPAG